MFECSYYYDLSRIRHSGFNSQEEADLSVANSLAGDRHFKLPKLRKYWFQIWRQNKYDDIQDRVSKIRKVQTNEEN